MKLKNEIKSNKMNSHYTFTNKMCAAGSKALAYSISFYDKNKSSHSVQVTQHLQTHTHHDTHIRSRNQFL